MLWREERIFMVINIWIGEIILRCNEISIQQINSAILFLASWAHFLCPAEAELLATCQLVPMPLLVIRIFSQTTPIEVSLNFPNYKKYAEHLPQFIVRDKWSFEFNVFRIRLNICFVSLSLNIQFEESRKKWKQIKVLFHDASLRHSDGWTGQGLNQLNWKNLNLLPECTSFDGSDL